MGDKMQVIISYTYLLQKLILQFNLSEFLNKEKLRLNITAILKRLLERSGF